MKRQKLLRLIEQVRNETLIEDRAPVVFDTLAIDFDERKVTYRGRTIAVNHRSIVFPLLGTDRMIVTKNGEDVL